VLYDTLLSHCSEEQVVAVLAHELGKGAQSQMCNPEELSRSFAFSTHTLVTFIVHTFKIFRALEAAPHTSAVRSESGCAPDELWSLHLHPELTGKECLDHVAAVYQQHHV